ncbi:MFS transporter [Shewanella yunxiaonensis]|uniref:MFS transporter n=1 Tax=Shewanella yunxiaonensis TaxID=2829809 RepID=A0ABX7YWS8_9GAMM|nr:MFS transporter [Shewanella yunxiaonensis]QUN07132.1 MFS transporter [Shewanella yunxiaonensis]
MSHHQTDSTLLDKLYDLLTGEHGERVSKDIDERAAKDQPHNFFSYLTANCMGKIADEISSARLILPWLFGLLGVPAFYTGLLVPLREAGVLIPQLAVAAAVRRLAYRKYVWLVGALLSAVSLFGMAWVAISHHGHTAGILIILMLLVFSLARGLCSVSAKDVLGKTIAKSRRGRLMGLSSGISGVAVLSVGIWLGTINLKDASVSLFAGLLLAGGILWLLAITIFAAIKEPAGNTASEGSTIFAALQQLKLLKTDKPFRHFVIARTLLLSVALAPPFYVLLAQAVAGTQLTGLGILIIANGLGTSLASPFWGYLGDHSSKRVMMIAASGAALLGIITFVGVTWHWAWLINPYGIAVLFFVLNIMHGGVRLGRKVYLVDMANQETRAAYVAVSNTVVGVLMLSGGFVGLLGDWFGAVAVVLLLALAALGAVFYLRTLPEVSEP